MIDTENAAAEVLPGVSLVKRDGGWLIERVTHRQIMEHPALIPLRWRNVFDSDWNDVIGPSCFFASESAALAELSRLVLEDDADFMKGVVLARREVERRKAL
jgi:hypothetical protein